LYLIQGQVKSSLWQMEKYVFEAYLFLTIQTEQYENLCKIYMTHNLGEGNEIWAPNNHIVCYAL